MLYTNATLRKLIIPLVFESLLAILVGMVDTIMIAGVGEAAVSGVSLVDNINILIINITAALATGGAVVAGHFIGKKDPQNANKAAWQLLLFSFWLSMVVTILLLLFHKPLLHAIFGRVDEEVMNSAVTYLVITGISICPLAIYNGCAALFRAMSDSKTTMYIALMMNLINIVGNAILIYIAKIGVAGAAIATTVSRTAAAVVIFMLLFRTNKLISLKGQITWKPDFGIIKKMLYIGVPNGIENSLFQLGKILLLSLIATFGTYSIAANAVANTLASLNVLPGQAINMALVSVSAVCVGAGDYKQVRYYTRKLMLWAEIPTIAISALFLVFLPQIVKIYQLSGPTEELTLQVVRYHAVMAVLLWVLSFTLPNTLRSAGDVVWSMIIALFSMWVFRIGFAYLFSYCFHMGLLGIWIAMTIDWGFRALIYTIRYLGHRWERMV